MKLSKSSKKVSWALDDDPCQAKLFRSKDCPSQVCLNDGLPAKKSRILHYDGLDTTDLPHGLKVRTYANQVKKEVSLIPKIKWKCPPKFVLSSNWAVASGEESQEAEAQKLRGKQVVGAVYPLMSYIPPSPSVSLEIEECHQADCDVPLVPITSMEDEDTVDTLFDLAAPIITSIISNPPALLSQDLLVSGNPNTSQNNSAVLEPATIQKPELDMSLGVEADIIAAATAAITMVMKCEEQGSLIDRDLLIKILTNPEMTEKLMKDCGAIGRASAIPLSESKPDTPLIPMSSTQANEQKRVQPAVDSRSSRSSQEDTFPVSRSNQVAHPVLLPQANESSLPSDTRPKTSPVSCVKPVSLPKPESNRFPLPNETLPDSNSRLSTPDTVTVPLSPFPLPSKGPDIVLLSQPGKVKPSINPRPPQPVTVQFSRSKPANGNMHSLVDEVLTALNSRLPQPDTVPISVSKSLNLPVTVPDPVLTSIEVDMVASHKVANENFRPLGSVSRSTLIKVQSRGYVVPVSGLSPASPVVCSSGSGSRVLSPRPTNGNLNNILKGVRPTLNTFTLPVKSIVKEANYYKSLIKQHGGEKQGTQTQDQIISLSGNHANHLQPMELIHNSKPIELKSKSQKSCFYYNSRTGCRNGSNCSYQHDTSSQLRGGGMLENRRVKRMKL